MTASPVVDAAAHPAPRNPEDIRAYMTAPLKNLRFPGLDGYFYPAPEAEFLPGTSDGYPGSDPDMLRHTLIDTAGADAVVLLPLTRGLLPDLDMNSELCAATNRWLAEEWLSRDSSHFYGSIRINPADPERAIAEIERWADHPQMVQVAVTLQAHHPYGQRMFRPVWECAAQHLLPVAVHADGLGGNEFWPTSVGYPLLYAEYAAQYPINYVVHLMSLIAEGVFEAIDDLVFVFADGGIDMLHPLLWRFDSDWRALRSVTPWVKRQPLEYLTRHVRFCSQSMEGPTDPALMAEWLTQIDAQQLLLYSSNFPSASYQPTDSFVDASPVLRDRIMGGNALDLYPKIGRR